jgi:uncharacterized membrane protein
MFMHGAFFWGLIILGLVVLAIIVVVLVRRRRDRLSTPTAVATDGQDSSVIILRERFARGEITKDQYDEMHQTLASTS